MQLLWFSIFPYYRLRILGTLNLLLVYPRLAIQLIVMMHQK
nr:MAG TPA: hypothetical protein [Caudoviricetes sp.]